MPVPAYMKIAEAPGSVEVKGREDTIEVIAFRHEVMIPTDPHTGKLAGVRRHEPLVITKAFDKSSPYLYQFCVTGRMLKSVEIKWYQIDPTGKEVEYFNHLLERAIVVSVKPFMPNTKDPAFDRLVHMEEVSFRYEKITWTFVDGTIQYFDSWTETRQGQQ